MNEKDLRFIQDQIGYDFKRSDLLQQAFVRRSYAKENGGGDNEILEFIGDKALDIAVVRYLSKCYGRIADESEGYEGFLCDMSEGELTELKRRLVEKKMLSHRIEMLDLDQYLIMGAGDVLKNVNQEKSVKEDLFEAIIGAVAVDSDWNFDAIQSAVEIMLAPEIELGENDGENYVALIQRWTGKMGQGIPWYHFEERSYQSSWYFPFEGVSQHIDDLTHIERYKYWCLMKIDDELPIFRGFGESKSEARRAVCQRAYEYLQEHALLNTIQHEIADPNVDDAINQLEILARRGYFSIPSYTFSESHDQNGNPIWDAECCISEYDETFHAEATIKKDAKKLAAFRMLGFVLE